MLKLILIALGGAIGAVTRYLFSGLVQRFAGALVTTEKVRVFRYRGGMGQA